LSLSRALAPEKCLEKPYLNLTILYPFSRFESINGEKAGFKVSVETSLNVYVNPRGISRLFSSI
jgi:hypothetical protein